MSLKGSESIARLHADLMKGKISREEYDRELQKLLDSNYIPPELNTVQQPSYTPKPARRGPSKGVSIFIAIFFAVACLIIYNSLTSKPSQQNKTGTSKSGNITITQRDPDDPPPCYPVPIKNGEIVDHPVDERHAPFSVSTTPGTNYYIVLKDLSAGSPNRTAFYVEGGKTAEIEVALGEYEVYYATGETWYGETYIFGDDTMYYKCDGTFDFYDDGEYYQGWTIELYPQTNGNMDTDPISGVDFPTK